MKNLKRLCTIGLAGLFAFWMFTGCDALANSSCEHTGKWCAGESAHWYEYTCGCPSPDIAELHSDYDEDGDCDVCGYYMGIEPIYTQKAFWNCIEDLRETDIERIETVEYAGSIAPNIRKPIECKTSTLAGDIEVVYIWLKSLQDHAVLLADEECYLPGAGVKIFTVYISESYFTISTTGNNYLNIDGQFYKQDETIPSILGETTTYQFESYYDDAQLYINGEKVKDYSFDLDKLVCIEKGFGIAGELYELSTDIGSLYIYDAKHFIRNDVQYEIIGSFDFSAIFEDFPVNRPDGEFYHVSIVDTHDLFFDKPTEEYFVAGTVITLRMYPLTDVDMIMHINGEPKGNQTGVVGDDGNWIWEYSFVVPAEDIVVTFTFQGGW